MQRPHGSHAIKAAFSKDSLEIWDWSEPSRGREDHTHSAAEDQGTQIQSVIGTSSEPGFIPRRGLVPCKMESSLKRLQGWGIHPAGTLFITYCMLAVYQLQKNKPPRENGWPLYARLSQGHN